ncbi:3'-5' exonuclease [Gulosibacter faecalis]|jgi:DNA polymerase-3 subunit epsilon|uniref:3'-5' exonuclease n=1 Tax=Gulosibacter faecalis TaxID=272240 RepID=A0ABW5UX94_9MICO|nr:3'-5' exonuclease [Gulosibacter faecalis]
MTVSFTAVDFETANRSPASACAVGVVRVRDGEFVERDTWLIHPPAGHDEFEPFNIQLHGVSPERVSAAPEWPESLQRLIDFIGDDVVVAHNAGFDIGVIVAATRASLLAVPGLRYFCSLRLARRSYTLPSYKLPSAAAAAGYTLDRHHDPLADAEACAAIVVDVARTGGFTTMDDLASSSSVQIRELEPEDAPDHDRLVADATF